MNRLYNLDYLRGFVAFGIMVFHYLQWTIGHFNANTFLGRIGIYGVSIFYILSGLTLFHVYYDNMKPTINDVLLFAKRRIFRIFPLLWLVTIISILLTKGFPNFYNLFLNLSGLFGFIKPTATFSLGVWSIGNELVFYSFFPLFVLFTKSNKTLMIILSLFLFLSYIYFAYFVINPNINLSDQWADYVNPFNQIFLFLGGFLLGFFFKKINLNGSTNIIILLCGLTIFIFYPVKGETSNLIFGVNRLIFTSSSLMIVLAFYKSQIKLPAILHTPFALLGEISYSIYLLHPIIYDLIKIVIRGVFNIHFSETINLVFSTLATLGISYLVYEYFEKFFTKRNRTIRS